MVLKEDDFTIVAILKNLFEIATIHKEIATIHKYINYTEMFLICQVLYIRKKIL